MLEELEKGREKVERLYARWEELTALDAE